MSHLPDGDILQFALQIYETFGENLEKTTTKVYLFRTINVIILCLTIMFILEACFDEKGVMLIKTFESAITILHVLIKYVAFMYGKKGLKTIIEARSRFWDPQTINTGTAQFANKLNSFTKILNTVLLVVFIISQELYWLKPIFNSGDMFMMNARVPYNYLPLEAVALFMQYYSICIVTPTVMTHDGLYLAICAHLTIQLRLLKCRIYEAAVGKWEDLRECIEYHILIFRSTPYYRPTLRKRIGSVKQELIQSVLFTINNNSFTSLSIFNQMQEIYSWVLLMQYFISLGILCVQLYILNSRVLNVVDSIELLIYLGTMYCEVAFYSVPIEDISLKFTDIGNAVYMSRWYEKSPGTRKKLLTIMTYSQVTRFLKGGGIIPLNMDMLGSIFRKSFSLYVLLKNVLRK